MLVTRDHTIGKLWLNPNAREALLRYVPELTRTPHLSFIFKNMTLAGYAAA